MRLTYMPPRRRHLRVAIVSSLLAVACQRGASVEGELSNGAAKGAYQRVSLVRNPGDSLTSAIDGLCAADRADVQRTNERIQLLQAEMVKFRRKLNPRLSGLEQVALGDSIDRYRTAASEAQRALNERPDTTYQKILSLVEAATDTQVQASNEGQFHFTGRKPGKYLLYAEWVTNRGADQFLAPVDASAGRALRQSLDRSTLSSRLHCR